MAIEHTVLEADIERLSASLKERGAAEVTKETLRQVIREQALRAAPPVQPVPAEPAAPVQPTPSPLPEYLKAAPAEVKLAVEKLLDLAWHKGINAAFKKAQKQGPLILDAFHDSLTDKFYEEFKKRGLIK